MHVVVVEESPHFSPAIRPSRHSPTSFQHLCSASWRCWWRRILRLRLVLGLVACVCLPQQMPCDQSHAFACSDLRCLPPPEHDNARAHVAGRVLHPLLCQLGECISTTSLPIDCPPPWSLTLPFSLARSCRKTSWCAAKCSRSPALRHGSASSRSAAPRCAISARPPISFKTSSHPLKTPLPSSSSSF